MPRSSAAATSASAPRPPRAVPRSGASAAPSSVASASRRSSSGKVVALRERSASVRVADDRFPSLPVMTSEEMEANLDAIISSGYRGTRTVHVTPSLAARLLALNTGNRRMIRRKIDEFVANMTSGGFINTGEPVILSSTGILNDGQNRLQAVVEADATVEMDICFGVPREAFTLTNTGSSRTAGDVLHIRGVTSAPTVAATVRLLMAHRLGLPEHLRDRFDNAEVDQAFKTWPEVTKAIDMVAALEMPAQFKGTALYAAVSLALRAPNHGALSQWLETLATGLALDKDNPAHQLRERLLRPGKDDPGGRDRQMVRFALMIKSWALFRAGSTVPMREFRWSRGGREPFPSLDGLSY